MDDLVGGNTPEEISLEVRTMIEGLMKEGERAAVVVGAARLELALEHLLKKVMQENPGGSDDLFDSDRNLGTFSAKIATAFRLGLIDLDIEHCLQLIRRIRNDFAHSIGTETLSDSSHLDRLRNLLDYCKKDGWYKTYYTLLKVLSTNEKLVSFSVALVVLIFEIELAAMTNERFVPKHMAALRP